MARHSSTPWRERDVLTPPEVADILCRSRPTIYAALKSGEIPSFKVGGRILIPVAAIKALIDQPAA